MTKFVHCTPQDFYTDFIHSRPGPYVSDLLTLYLSLRRSVVVILGRSTRNAILAAVQTAIAAMVRKDCAEPGAMWEGLFDLQRLLSLSRAFPYQYARACS